MINASAPTGISNSNTISFAAQLQNAIASYEVNADEANATASQKELSADMLGPIKNISARIVECEERYKELEEQAEQIKDLKSSIPSEKIKDLKSLMSLKRIKDLKSSMPPEQIKDPKSSTSLERINSLNSSMSLAEIILKRRRAHSVAPLLVAHIRTNFDFVEPPPIILSDAKGIERVYDKIAFLEKVTLEEKLANLEEREKLQKQLNCLVKDLMQNFNTNMA